MGKFIDLTGMRFNRLIVIERVSNVGRDPAWLCRCDCGKTIRVTSGHLKSGHTKSCGCYRSDVIVCQGHKNATHGMKGSRLYRIWVGMKTRCLNSNMPYYKNYGGRGITICEEWLEFEPFRDWALANGYRDDLTIDRLDVNGNYCPSNCAWKTPKEQGNNTRFNRYIEYSGKRMTLKQWSESTGIKATTISERLRRGWSIEDSLTTPVQRD